MKTNPLLLTFLFILMIAPLSCSEDDPAPVIKPGQVTFWSNFQGEPIDVRMNGNFVGTITAISSTAPECGSSGNVTVTRDPGTYSFTAEDGTYTWSGNVTITDDGCLTMLLHD